MIEINVSITKDKIQDLLQRHSIPVTDTNIETFKNRILHDIEYIDSETKLAVSRELEYIIYRLLYDGDFPDKPVPQDKVIV
ncbi:MAG: hypothetical protein ACM3UZ_13445 [Acidobacteriota bacterium]